MPASETDYLTHEHNFLSRSHDESARRTPVSYTHLTLPTKA